MYLLKYGKKQYIVYVHLDQSSGDVVFSKCCCPAGVGGRCKHVAATLFQLLDYVELGLSDIPDDKTCTQEIQKWHVPKKSTTQEALLFEDLICSQDTYEKDKKTVTAHNVKRFVKEIWSVLNLV